MRIHRVVCLDAVGSGKSEMGSAVVAAANRAAFPLSCPSYFGGPSGRGGAIEARDSLHRWRRALGHKRDRAVVRLRRQPISHALALRHRQTEIAQPALVRAWMGKVCLDPQ